MNWIQSLGASLFGLQPYMAETWGSDIFLLDPKSEFDSGQTDLFKLNAVFNNPAVLKVFKLQCDMFSQACIYVYNKDGVSKKNDPFLRLIENPNPFQQKSQFLWDYMFWKMLGNAYCYADSDVPSDNNKLYFLDSSKMTFPDAMRKYQDMIVLSNDTMNKINDIEIEYRYSAGDTTKFKWGKITHIADLSSGTGNWFRARSVINSLYEIIANSRHSVSSKNINVRYAGKYMVAGESDPSNITQMPLGEGEKQDIEQKMNGVKTVHAFKSMIDIKRFVEQSAIIGDLDKSYWDDYFKIGSLYGIPGEVLEAFTKGGATYENQEKARGAHVDYTLAPAGEQLANAFEKRFGYTDKDIVFSWDHLPFTQVFAKDKATTDKLKSEALINYMKAGVTIDEINATLDTEFTELNYDTANKANNNTGQAGADQGAGATGQA